MISETKLDNSFPVSQFLVDDYTPPFRLDRDNNRGGIMLFVREDIPCKLLSIKNRPMEGFYVEINLRKTKRLLCCSHNPNRCKIDFHLENLNPNKPSCTDLILTNKVRSFQHSCVIETGLSDFHKMTVTVMKTFFEKLQPRVVNYRDYKYFENDKFSTDLLSEFGKANIKEKENGLNNLLNACKRILDIHAPRQQKYARGNHMPFMNKALSREIMSRTQLRNKFLKDQTCQHLADKNRENIFVY